MNQVRIFASAGAGLLLAALGWLLSDAPGGFVDVSADMLNRSAGVALLGIAMIAAGLVFRAATRAEQKPASATTRPPASEYRRGFDGRVVRARPEPHQAMQRGVIVSLRRAVAEQGSAMPSVETGAVLPMPEMERLQNRLRNRAAQRRAHDTDMAKRRFVRIDVDLHGLAPR
jgi:hypothetical protein